jgi:hypothetical protein
MKLYDEISKLSPPSLGDDCYADGFDAAIDLASELAKKHDEEIEILKNKIQELEGHIIEVNFYNK